jgi:hypothetical protein
VIFNNHPAGQAVANALEIAPRLDPGRSGFPNRIRSDDHCR